MQDTADQEARFRAWWDWLAISLFVLLTVDMITTMGIIVEMGVEVESNPLMRYLYGQGIVPVVVANLVALVIAAACFQNVVSFTRQLGPPWDRYFAFTVEIWLGVMLALGLVVFANNMSVIIFGASLL